MSDWQPLCTVDTPLTRETLEAMATTLTEIGLANCARLLLEQKDFSLTPAKRAELLASLRPQIHERSVRTVIAGWLDLQVQAGRAVE